MLGLALNWPTITRRAPQLLLSCCRSAQNCEPPALMHCVYEPVQANEQRPFRQDTMALGSVGHTLPHLPLRGPRQRPRSVLGAQSPCDSAGAARRT